MTTTAQKSGSELPRAATAHFEKRSPKLFALLGEPGRQPRIVTCRELERFEGLKASCVVEVRPGGYDGNDIHFLQWDRIATAKTLTEKTAQFLASAPPRPPLSNGRDDGRSGDGKPLKTASEKTA